MENESKRLAQEQELVLGPPPQWTKRLFLAFPAFRHYNYRLFFVGQFISLVGTWMQIVALGWLVLQITNSAFWVAFVQALDLLPILLFSLPAGILADRIEKRLIVIAMQAVMMIVAFLFAILTQFGLINILFITALALLLGISHAIEMPARQSFMFEVVGRKDLPSGIALNVGMFNSARVIGPAVAGVLIALFNIQVAFFLNGASFLAVLFVLFKMRVKPFILQAIHSHPLEQLKEGVRFSASHPVIRTLLIVACFISLVQWAHQAILAVVARDILHVGSEGFGILLSAAGLGALFGAIFISSRATTLDISKTIGTGSFAVAICLLLFSLVNSLFLALLLLFIIGFGLVLQISLANSTIQRSSPDYIRGRVMGVYILMFLGTMPIGNIAIGALAEAQGVQLALRIFGVVSLLGSLFYFLFLQKSLKTAI